MKTTKLVNDLIRDLIVDYRCAKRDGLKEYEGKVLSQLKTLIPKRHSAKLDRYGWPIILKNV